ncbi:hypothetical protein D3C87_1338290 [compost metagenome]
MSGTPGAGRERPCTKRFSVSIGTCRRSASNWLTQAIIGALAGLAASSQFSHESGLSWQ